MDPTSETTFSFEILETLRNKHPAWRLLRSDHAPLIASFLHKTFLKANERLMEESRIVEKLENELFALREIKGTTAFPKSAREYLNDWADPEKGWLRKFYQQGSDEAFFDITPATERALTWLSSLTERKFVGTESRLLTLFDLLRQMHLGTETNPEVRLAELHKQREAIEAEIERVAAGEIPLLDDTRLRDRFQQFTQLAREFLGDFREVEANFRRLDRDVREQIALWEGGKATLLEEILGKRNAITDSDQGRSFHAFWDFIMSPSRQEELTRNLEDLLEHPAVQEMDPDPRLARIHYDWHDAGDHTQRTVSRLSSQLRRFLDDQAWLENRRIMDLLHAIETKAIEVREQLPVRAFMDIAESAPRIDLPMERPLYKPPFKPNLVDEVLAAAGEDIDTSALFLQQVVDRQALETHVEKTVQARGQVSLSELLESRPLQQGLAELLVYLDLDTQRFKKDVDERRRETVSWTTADDPPLYKTATLPRIIYLK